MAECASVAANPAMSALAKASFGLFLGALPSTSSPQGCFLSPLSIVYALSLAVNGAGPKSPTHTELLRVIAGPDGQQQGLSEADLNSDLGRAMALLNGGKCGAADGATGPGSEMILANSIWTHRGMQLKQAYVESMQSLFQATAREATNGAADINAWVADVTRGLITDLITTDNFDAVLANAIYFKGLWEHAFKPELTRPGNFTTSTGEAKQVHMMSQLFEGRGKEALTGVHKEGLYDAISLPYKGGAFRAVALLPSRGVDVGAAIRDWAAGPQEFQSVGRVRVTLPKFKVTSTMSLVPLLKGLGVEAAFSSAAANFSRMADGQLYISDVLHKAVVEVDEQGTVAAAATAVMMMRCVPMPPQELVFDRPFVFMIYHNPTGLPAFVGVVNDPSAA